jgi:hypothetical protein
METLELIKADKEVRLQEGTIVKVVPGIVGKTIYNVAAKAEGKLFTIVGNMQWKYGAITYILQPYKFKGKKSCSAFIAEASADDINNYNPFKYN